MTGSEEGSERDEKDLLWIEAAHDALTSIVETGPAYTELIGQILELLCGLFDADRACYMGPYDPSAESCLRHHVDRGQNQATSTSVIVTRSLSVAMRRARGGDACWLEAVFDSALLWDDVRQELHIWVEADERSSSARAGALIALHWQEARAPSVTDGRLFAGLARRAGQLIRGARLRDEHARNEALLGCLWRTAPLALAALDEHGRCRKVNALAGRWLGRSPDQMMHTLAKEWLPPELSTVPIAGHASQWTGELTGLANTKRPVEITQTPVVTPDETLTLLQMADLSELRGLENELYGLQRHKLFGNLSASVVHDLNNLLTVIVAALDRAKPAHESPYRAELLGDALEATRRCETLCRQLLTLGRTRPGALELVKPDTQLAAMQRLLGRVLQDDQQVSLSLAAPLATVELPMGALQQIIVNLLVNAREAIGSDGQVEIRTSVRAGHFHLEIEDDGRGMQESVLRSIFDPSLSTKEEQGAGIGLAVVHRLVSQMGGRLDVQSSPGNGSRFVVSFALAHSPPQASPPTLDPRWRGDGLMALVCENEPVLRHVIVRALAERGFEVASAADGVRVLELIEAGGRFDLLVTDLVMAKAGGVDTAIACNQGEMRTPVVFLSGLMGRSALPSLSVPTAFLRKPFRTDELLAVARSVLLPTVS